MGFSRQENWSGLSCSPPGDLPDPGIEPVSLLGGRVFTVWDTREALQVGRGGSQTSHRHQSALEGLLKHRVLDLTPRVSDSLAWGGNTEDLHF